MRQAHKPGVLQSTSYKIQSTRSCLRDTVAYDEALPNLWHLCSPCTSFTRTGSPFKWNDPGEGEGSLPPAGRAQRVGEVAEVMFISGRFPTQDVLMLLSHLPNAIVRLVIDCAP